MNHDRFLVRVLSLTSGEQHPDATSEQFYVSSPPFGREVDMRAQLAVANHEVLFCAIHDVNDGEFALSAIDWRSGEARAVRISSPLESSCSSSDLYSLM